MCCHLIVAPAFLLLLFLSGCLVSVGEKSPCVDKPFFAPSTISPAFVHIKTCFGKEDGEFTEVYLYDETYHEWDFDGWYKTENLILKENRKYSVLNNA